MIEGRDTKLSFLVSFVTNGLGAVNSVLAKDGLEAAKSEYEKLTAGALKKFSKNWRRGSDWHEGDYCACLPGRDPRWALWQLWCSSGPG